MKHPAIIKRTAVGLLCLVALALSVLNIRLYAESMGLPEGADNQQAPAVTVAADIVQTHPDADTPAAVQVKDTADEIAVLRTRLAATEDELYKADQKWADIMAEQQEKRKKGCQIQ